MFTVRRYRKKNKNKTMKGGSGFFSFLTGYTAPTDASNNPTPTPDASNNPVPADKDSSLFIFTTDKISSQIIPAEYKSIGIIHMSKASAVNMARQLGSDVMNAFGNAGLEVTIYDKLRNDTLKELDTLIKPDQKVFNLRLDIERDMQGAILLHLYGDLCEANNSSNIVVEETPVNFEPSPLPSTPATEVPTDMNQPPNMMQPPPPQPGNGNLPPNMMQPPNMNEQKQPGA